MDRPHVHVNVAMTIDGKIDSVARSGARISSSLDGERVDRLRSEMDAILVGGKTLIDEDPRLTIKSRALRAERLRRGQPENPAKVGIVSAAEIKSEGRFMKDGPARRIIYTTRRTDPHRLSQLLSAGVEVFILGEDTRVDLNAALVSLASLGMRNLLVEGGGTIIAEFFRLGLVDEMSVYIAATIFGGAHAPTPADGPGFLLEQAPRLHLISVDPYDEEGGILVRYSSRNKE